MKRQIISTIAAVLLCATAAMATTNSSITMTGKVKTTLEVVR